MLQGNLHIPILLGPSPVCRRKKEEETKSVPFPEKASLLCKGKPWQGETMVHKGDAKSKGQRQSAPLPALIYVQRKNITQWRGGMSCGFARLPGQVNTCLSLTILRVPMSCGSQGWDCWLLEAFRAPAKLARSPKKAPF